jgi:catechol 2,3-dioxygenase-like lactoylglutathione lyase family enzyme
MSEEPPADVSAEPPNSPVPVVGTDHITLIGSNPEDTIAFYRDILGMPLVLRQPNLDQPAVEHLFFDTGDGRILTFFVTDDRESHAGGQRPGVGAVHHLAFRLDPERFEQAREGLEATGKRFNEFDRGPFQSLYTRDHNGLTIELATDKYRIPDDRRGEVYATAQEKRVEAGAEYVGDEHLEAALEELGIEVHRYDLPDAPTGAGV